MPKHNLYFTLPEFEMTGKDGFLEIYAGGKVLGKLTFSKGSIDYAPKHRGVNNISLTWEKFDLLMQTYEAGKIKLKKE